MAGRDTIAGVHVRARRRCDSAEICFSCPRSSPATSTQGHIRTHKDTCYFLFLQEQI
jgi:hypothetical protein